MGHDADRRQRRSRSARIVQEVKHEIMLQHATYLHLFLITIVVEREQGAGKQSHLL